MDADIEPAAGAGSGAKKKPGIMDLPIETQKQIFSFVSGLRCCGMRRDATHNANYGIQSSQMDLIALSLVSKHMRDIAASHLYRKFHIVR